ncbi:MarR family transcriptional regulator [Streptomyces sp. NPDC048606]|uniref:MarR family transcriptional regulator n=1 Tax=Streptomyces sp. NPDC048606 TaxID=3154726 RepID=UPI00342929E2
MIQLLDAARAGTYPTPGWLGEQLRLNSAGTTALVDRPQRLPLVRRSRDTADRRRGARELGWAFFGAAIGEVVEAAEGFEASELETVRRLLAAVVESAGRARSA